MKIDEINYHFSWLQEKMIIKVSKRRSLEQQSWKSLDRLLQVKIITLTSVRAVNNNPRTLRARLVNSTTPYTFLCTCTFPKVFVHIYLGGRCVHMCINTLKMTTSHPHISKDWTFSSFSLFPFFFLRLLFLLRSFSRDLQFALIPLHHKGIAPTIIPPFLHRPRMMTPCPPSRLSLFIIPSSLQRATPEKRNNIRRTLESIFLSRRWYIAFVPRNTAIRESPPPSRGCWKFDSYEKLIVEDGRLVTVSYSACACSFF